LEEWCQIYEACPYPLSILPFVHPIASYLAATAVAAVTKAAAAAAAGFAHIARFPTRFAHFRVLRCAWSSGGVQAVRACITVCMEGFYIVG
jgi:hypothetical protein